MAFTGMETAPVFDSGQGLAPIGGAMIPAAVKTPISMSSATPRAAVAPKEPALSTEAKPGDMLFGGGTAPERRMTGIGQDDYHSQLQHLNDNEGRIHYLKSIGLLSPGQAEEESAYNDLQKGKFKMEHPWGTPESAHPGLLGKIGHVASEVGQVAAPYFGVNPGMIPGTRMAMGEEAAGALGRLQLGAKVGQEEGAHAALETKSDTPAKTTPEADAFAASQRIDNAISSGNDPSPADISIVKAFQSTKSMEKTPHVDTPEQAYIDNFTKVHGDTPESRMAATKEFANLKTPPPKPDAKPLSGTVTGPDGRPTPAWGFESKTADGKKTFTDIAGNPLMGFVPPPNFAEIAPGMQQQRMRAQTKDRFGPDGKPHLFSWNESTQKYDIDQGFSASGAAGGREAQANVIMHAGNNLVAEIYAHKADLGGLEAWYKSHALNVPYMGDPEMADLDSQLRSFAALQPAMHGFRSTSALDTFEKIIGGLAKNPDATIASINGILKTASSMGTTGAPAAGELTGVARWKKDKGIK